MFGATATAGCLDAFRTGPTTVSDPTTGPGPTTAGPSRVTTVDGHVIDVGSMDVQASILTMGVHTDVRAYRAASFLRVPVVLGDLSGEPVTDADANARIRDGASTSIDGGASITAHLDHAHDGPGVVLAMAVPTGEYASGEVRLDLGAGNSIHVPIIRSALAAFADPPAFAVHGLAIDEPIEGDSLHATVTIENVGGTAGRFLAELGPTSVSDSPEFHFDVPSHEEVRHDVSVPFTAPGGSGDATIRLDWGVDQLERSVEVGGS